MKSWVNTVTLVCHRITLEDDDEDEDLDLEPAPRRPVLVISDSLKEGLQRGISDILPHTVAQSVYVLFDSRPLLTSAVCPSCFWKYVSSSSFSLNLSPSHKMKTNQTLLTGLNHSLNLKKMADCPVGVQEWEFAIHKQRSCFNFATKLKKENVWMHPAGESYQVNTVLWAKYDNTGLTNHLTG